MIHCCQCTHYLGPMQFRSIAHMHMNQYHGSLQPPDKSMHSGPPSLCPMCMCHMNVCPCLRLMETCVGWLVYTHSWCRRINGVFLCKCFDVSGIKSRVQFFVVRRRLNVMHPCGDVGMIDSFYVLFSIDPFDRFSFYVSIDLQSDFPSQAHVEGNNPSFLLLLISQNSQFVSIWILICLQFLVVRLSLDVLICLNFWSTPQFMVTSKGAFSFRNCFTSFKVTSCLKSQIALSLKLP
jgi:hypothetical protein